jgi:signal transduction histidine kinase/CheY-like chemotaxis protein
MKTPAFRLARSIRAKLALLIAVSVGAAVLLAFGVATYRELNRFGEAKRAELQATAEVLAGSVGGAVAAGDRGGMQQALNAIGRLPDVRFAEIRGTGGEVLAEAGTGVALESDRAPQAGGEISAWRMLTQGSFFVTANVVKGGVPQGTIGLLVDTSELSERLRNAVVAAILSAGAAIAIGLLIGTRLQRSITGPLGELTEVMNRVRVTSDFRQHVLRRTDDETGQLVDAFNDMLGQIRRRDDELEEHRTGLERKVEERTHDLALARDQAEAANRAKSDFLATMSHEIRTPMNGMLVMAELLAGTELPVRQQRYAETIARSGQTLLTIINDILDLSKIEAGKLELEQGRVPVATIVGDVLSLFAERAQSKGLDLAAHLAADVPAAIEADPTRLSQVLGNLVNNALKFTGSGHVKISVERQEGDALAFAVEDTGIGIPADKVDRIFEAFTQADQSTTRRYGGTGLGLSICQRLVAAWGGEIRAESEEGRGSRFIFTLPGRALEPAVEMRTAGERSALLAVDGTATRSVLGAALRDAGFSVRTGVAATTTARSDVIFAGPDWIEARGARAQADAKNAIVCVAEVGNGRVDALIAGGLADGVLLRPIASGQVREILAAIEVGALKSLRDAQRRDAHADLPDLGGLSVLVADDSPVNREVVAEALARLNARATMVEDGRQAVAAFARGRFGVILMDGSMPEMDGFAATRAIRAREAAEGFSRTPIVALTAHVAGGAAENWQAAGMDDYVTKPFTMRALADCLLRWRGDGAAQPTVAAPIAALAQVVATEEGHPRANEERPEGPETQSSAPEDVAGIEGALDPETLASLRAIAGGSNIMLGKIFGLFRSHAPARLEALKQAVAAADFPKMATEAHALKSPSVNIGARRLGELCAAIEARARTADATLVSDGSLEMVEREFAAVLKAIEAEQGPLAAAANKQLQATPV